MNTPNIQKADGPSLLISYDKDSDVLTLCNGEPANYDEVVTEHLIVNSTKDRTPVAVFLQNTAALLWPYLFPESQAERD